MNFHDKAPPERAWPAGVAPPQKTQQHLQRVVQRHNQHALKHPLQKGVQHGGQTGVRWLLVLGASLALLGCSAEPPDTHPDQWVTKRRAAFKQMTRTLEPISLAASGREPYRQPEVLAQALQLEQLSAQPWPLFTPDSNYPPTRAKAQVWSDAQGFKRAQDDYAQKVQQLVRAARIGDVEQTRLAVDAVGASCKACHRSFRNE